MTAHPSTAMVIDAPIAAHPCPGSVRWRTPPKAPASPAMRAAYFLVKLPRPVVGRGYFFAITYTSDEERSAARVGTQRPGPATTGAYHAARRATDVTVVDRLDGHAVRALNLAPAGRRVATSACRSVWVGRSRRRAWTASAGCSPDGEPARTSRTGGLVLRRLGLTQAFRSKTSSSPRRVSQGAESVKQRHSSTTSGAR